MKVNERLQTTASGVWAVGDCAGSPHFTHIAFDDHRVVTDNLAGGDRVTTGRQVPFCMFTDPELARIGISELEAKERGIAYRLTKVPMIAVLRTRTVSETRGFFKGPDRYRERSHSWFHRLGNGGWRNYRHGTSRHVGRSALYRFKGHDIYTPNDVRRAYPVVLGGFA